MTEDSYQAGRVVMRKINHMRGLITGAERRVGKWTKIEASYRTNLQHGKADGAKKALDSSMKKLEELRAKFAAIKFPESDIVNSEIERCSECGAKLEKGICPNYPDVHL